MKIINTTALMICFSLCGNAIAHGDINGTHSWWINLGLGGGTTINHSTFNHGGGAVQLSFNGMLTDSLFITFESTGSVIEYDNTVRDIGALLGYKCKHPYWYWSGAAGIAYQEKEVSFWWKETNPAIPLEAQIFWTPIRHFGIGLIGHAVVSKNPTAAVLFGIQVS